MKRREFIAGMASVPLVPNADPDPYRDPAYVDLLTDRVNKSLFDSGGSASLRSATRHLGRVRKAVSESRDPRLLSSASSLARQVALVHYDSAGLPEAEAIARTAVAYAHAAGDGDKQVLALNNLAMFCAYAGDGHRGQQYARRALTVPDASPGREAQAHMQLGRALGLLNEKRASATHLTRAQQLGADHLPALECADMTGGVGVALYEQGDWDAARSVLTEAVTLISPLAPLLGANYHARQVQSALGASQPLLAAELMAPLVRVAPLVSSARLDGYLSEILRLSARWRKVPEVDDMWQQLRDLLL
ncbi:hypothetical protein GCM10022221_01950 [Actinocorallia aurea]